MLIPEVLEVLSDEAGDLLAGALHLLVPFAFALRDVGGVEKGLGTAVIVSGKKWLIFPFFHERFDGARVLLSFRHPPVEVGNGLP